MEAALRLQRRLAATVDTGARLARVHLVAGADAAYHQDGERLVAAVVVIALPGLEVVEQASAEGRVTFPYVPGLFGFREAPIVLRACRRLRARPDVLVCDGQGIAHPRRFGLACHLGVLTGRPAFGVGKTRLVGSHTDPASARGSSVPLVDAGEEVGAVLRTQDGVKPVYVSAGHRIGLAHACRLTLALTPRYRLPETTRQADRLSRAALR